MAETEATDDQGVGDKAVVKKSKTRSKIREDERVANFKETVSTAGGRATIWHYMSSGRPYGASYSGSDTHHTAYLEGRRGIAIEILDDLLTHAPAEYILMQNEAVSRDARYGERTGT